MAGLIAGADIMAGGRTPHPHHPRPGMVSQGNDGEHEYCRREAGDIYSAEEGWCQPHAVTFVTLRSQVPDSGARNCLIETAPDASAEIAAFACAE
jgi:hypothetical protein